MENLLSSLTIKTLVLKNRIMVSPMCQYSSLDGFASDWHLVHLGSRAVGGAGIVMFEASAVSPEGRITPNDLGIYKDEHMENLQRIATFVHQEGAFAGIQLAHAGRKASCHVPWEGGQQIKPEHGGWQTWAPSAIPFKESDDVPREMSIEDIKIVREDFVKAAQRALQAGFKIIEIHAAHGYLLNEFLSPLANKREDEYGGDFENRARFLLEIIDDVKAVWPADLPIFVRISASDWAEGGWDIHDSVRLSLLLKTMGVDLIDCSSGGVVRDAKIETGPGYQVTFSNDIRRETGMLTGAVGMITEVDQANEIIESGKADLVIMAREFLRDPYFPLHAAQKIGAKVNWPVQYERAKDK